MSKMRWLILSQITWLLLTCSVFFYKREGTTNQNADLPVIMPLPEITQIPPLPQPLPPNSDPELANVQVPIPRNMRVYNRSGSQCVWCTIQMLGNYNKIPEVYNLTNFYKHATGPREVKNVLEGRNVKFRQTIRKDEDMLEEYVSKKKLGVGIGINRGSHCILVCHFDKANKIVKVIDNNDHQLRIQTWSLDRFRSIWSDWVFVIFPDNYPDITGNSESISQDPNWQKWWTSLR